jgi:hypothetical protein
MDTDSPPNDSQEATTSTPSQPEDSSQADFRPTGDSVSTVGDVKSGHGTYFAGMGWPVGSPIGGCGVPPEKAFDDSGKPLPFVALNTNSEFKTGANCGRWVQITLGNNCQGGGNTDFSICNGGSTLHARHLATSTRTLPCLKICLHP